MEHANRKLIPQSHAETTPVRHRSLGNTWRDMSVSVRKAMVVAVVASFALQGCSLFDVYPEPRRTRPDLLLPARTVDDSSHVGVNEAVAYARSLEDAYRARAQALSRARTGSNLGVISLALGAVGVAGGGGSNDLAAALGLGGAGLAAAANQVAVGVYRSIYFTGASAIECSVGKVEAQRSYRGSYVGVLASQGELAAALIRAEAARSSAYGPVV